MQAFGAALIVGPKGCGKTTTAKQQAKSYIEFQDEDERENDLLFANTHPSDLLKGLKPRLFDEWQDTPHTGTIRISGMKMYPMSLYESKESIDDIKSAGL